MNQHTAYEEKEKVKEIRLKGIEFLILLNNNNKTIK